MITLYSTGCPKCNVLKRKLEDRAIHYKLCSDITTIQNKGFTIMPMLEVDGEVMDFNKAIQWVMQQ